LTWHPQTTKKIFKITVNLGNKSFSSLARKYSTDSGQKKNSITPVVAYTNSDTQKLDTRE